MTTSPNARTAPIRQATKDDLAAIERLLAEAGLPTAGVAEILNTNAGDLFIAETEGAERQVVGVAGLEVRGDNALLRSVAVRPEWRSHGVGRELVRRIVAHAEAQRIHALYLLTMSAENYFPRFGFERIERDVVSPEIAETSEFKSVCPSSATAMVKPLR